MGAIWKRKKKHFKFSLFYAHFEQAVVACALDYDPGIKLQAC